MMLGPLIEQLGVALGGGVVQALDRRAQARMTARFMRAENGQYGLVWCYTQKKVLPIPTDPASMTPEEFNDLKRQAALMLHRPREAEDLTVFM